MIHTIVADGKILNAHNLMKLGKGISHSKFRIGVGNLTQNLKKSFANSVLTLLHSERPKLYGVLAVLRAIGLIACLQTVTNRPKPEKLIKNYTANTAK